MSQVCCSAYAYCVLIIIIRTFMLPWKHQITIMASPLRQDYYQMWILQML